MNSKRGGGSFLISNYYEDLWYEVAINVRSKELITAPRLVTISRTKARGSIGVGVRGVGRGACVCVCVCQRVEFDIAPSRGYSSSLGLRKINGAIPIGFGFMHVYSGLYWKKKLCFVRHKEWILMIIPRDLKRQPDEVNSMESDYYRAFT